MQLQDIMRTRVVTIDSAATPSAAWSRMRRHHVRHLVVTARGEPVGVLTANDVLDALGAGGGRFAVAVPKGRKLEAASEPSGIAAHIRAADGELTAMDRASIRARLGRALGRHAGAIERISVRTGDLNGPRGGKDRVCRIKVVLSGLPSVVFEHRDVSLSGAVDGALAGIGSAVQRALRRRRMKPLRRAASTSRTAISPSGARGRTR